MSKNRKLISFDWAIKRILRSKANFEILEGFLSELLFEDIIILEILESESNQNQQNDKFNRIDIKVKNQKEEIILIEIQYSSEMDYLQRILYATSKAIVEHLKSGVQYKEISKIISINILYFDFVDGDDYIYKGTTNFIGLHNKSLLQLNEKQKELYKTDKVEKIYPEYYLLKIKNFDNTSKNTLDEWINFLKNNLEGFKDGQHNIHYDVTYSSFKAILYMEDTNKNNGAFEYIKGSHKFNIKRLSIEYLNSISKDKKKLTKLTKNFLHNLVSIEGKKNSLIVMNAKGMHRRGLFYKDTVRSTIFVDYRFLHSLGNFLPKKLLKSDI